jgi:hypothetical protein
MEQVMKRGITVAAIATVVVGLVVGGAAVARTRQHHVRLRARFC